MRTLLRSNSLLTGKNTGNLATFAVPPLNLRGIYIETVRTNIHSEQGINSK